MRPKPIIPQFHQMVLTVALHKKSPAGFWTSPIRIRRSPMSNSHVQSAKAIAEDIAHLCCVPDDWRLQISDLAAWPFPTFCAKPRGGEYVLVQPFVPHPQLIALQFDVLPIACMNSDIVTTLLSAG